MALCWSTIFWGVLSFIGVIVNLIQFGFSLKTLSLELMTAFVFLYTIQCLCIGGCWLYGWSYPILVLFTVLLVVLLFLNLFINSFVKKYNVKKNEIERSEFDLLKNGINELRNGLRQAYDKK